METSRGAVCHGYHKDEMTPEKMDINGCYTLGRRDRYDSDGYQLLST